VFGTQKLAGGLGEVPAEPAQLKELLVPYRSGDMISWAVSARCRHRQEQRSVVDRAAVSEWRRRLRRPVIR
jgi:hypothetical protein